MQPRNGTDPVAFSIKVLLVFGLKYYNHAARPIGDGITEE
jgi:hypothetical protein